jgi:hypothetical protein
MLELMALDGTAANFGFLGAIRSGRACRGERIDRLFCFEVSAMNGHL